MKDKPLRSIHTFWEYFLLLFGFFISFYVSPLSGIFIIGITLAGNISFKKRSVKKKCKIILCFLLLITAGGCSPNDSDEVKINQQNSETTTNHESEQNIKKQDKLSNIKIHFIDTGNSDCIFVQTQDKNLLIDAGDNDDEQRVVNYLKELDVTAINYLVSTHPDADHCGGLDAVVSNFDIEQSYVANGSSQSKTYRDFIYSLSAKQLTPAVPLEDIAIPLDENTQMKFYNTHAAGEGNELSLVTLLESGDKKMLFMADATEKVENSIIDLLPDHIDILKVSHHGSKSATSDQFLKALNIEYAVIECGKNNKYHHPDQETLDRLQDHDIQIFRTDKKGNIIFTVENSKLSYRFSETTSNKGSAPVTKDPDNGQEETGKQISVPAEQNTQQDTATVYIPQTGKKYHSNPNCSNMKNPCAVSLSEAQSRGYEPCKKCY